MCRLTASKPLQAGATDQPAQTPHRERGSSKLPAVTADHRRADSSVPVWQGHRLVRAPRLQKSHRRNHHSMPCPDPDDPPWVRQKQKYPGRPVIDIIPTKYRYDRQKWAVWSVQASHILISSKRRKGYCYCLPIICQLSWQMNSDITARRHADNAG